MQLPTGGSAPAGGRDGAASAIAAGGAPLGEGGPSLPSAEGGVLAGEPPGASRPAAAGSAAPPPGEFGARAPALQVAQALAASAPAGRVELRLEPGELGAVEITFDFRDEGLRATVVSERAATGDLLRRHAEILLQHLRDAGFEGASLEFAHHGERQAGHGDDAAFASRRVDGAMADGAGPSGPAAQGGMGRSAVARDAFPAGIDRRI